MRKETWIIDIFILLKIAVISVSIYLIGLGKHLQALAVLLTMTIILTIGCIRRLHA